VSIDPAAANYVRRGINTGRNIGTVGGAVAGGLLRGLPKTHKNEHGETETRTPGERIGRGLMGALGLGYVGHQIGGTIGGLRNAHKWVSSKHHGSQFYGDQPKKPDWLKHAKNKAEAKAAWRAQALKTHPDHNQGIDKGFDKVKSDWALHEKFFKEAMLLGLADELHKIATLGTLLGGAAGYGLSPNTVKGKIVGTAIGAGAGHVLQNVGGLAKRKIVDEPHAREERELYGYQPYAQASQAQNFY
jgi:hypothetical protein